MTSNQIVTSSEPRRWIVVAALLAIVAIAVFVRSRDLNRVCLWYDEIWHAEVSNGHGSEFHEIPINQYIPRQINFVDAANARPWWQIPRHMEYLIHPPLYHLTLRLWRTFFGDAPSRLRILSASFSVLVVLLTFFAARFSANTYVGSFAALMMALSVSQIEEAQDGRGYTLLMAIGLLTAMVLQSLRREGLPARSVAIRAALIGIGAAAMMFTHYFAIGGCLAIGLFAAICLRGRARWLSLASLAIAAVVWTALWLPTVLQQLKCVPDTADIFLHETQPGWTQRTILRVLAMPCTLIADSTDQTAVWRIIVGIALLFAVVSATRRNPRSSILWLMWICGVIGCLAALDIARQTKHLTFVRYVLLASPALMILLAMHAQDGFRSRRIAIPILIVLGEIASLIWQGSPAEAPDVRPMMSYLQQHVHSGDVLVLPSAQPQGRDGQVLYLYLCYYTNVLPAPLIVPTEPVSSSITQAVPAGKKWWIISMNPDVQPEVVMPNSTVIDSRHFGDTGSISEVQFP